MEGYKPPFTITNEILSYVSSISEKIGRITATGNLEAKPHLRKNNRIKSIHSSLRIEANSLSLGQVRDVINGKMVLGEQKEIQEVKNAYSAYEQLSEINPYSVKDLMQFNGIMTKYVVEESGDFRRGEEGVFNGDQCIFMAPPARLVTQLMEDLFCWMKDAESNVHPLILSSVFHYEFVFFHPFSDGNGRMARLWHTAILAKWKPIFEYIPISEDNEQLSEYIKKLLGAMEYDIPYTSKFLMEKLGLKSKEELEKQKNVLYGVLLIVMGNALQALSHTFGGTTLQDFISGLMPGLSIGEMLVGVYVVGRC